MPDLADVKRTLKNLSASTDREKLKDMDATILFDIKGEDGGLWTVDIDHGAISVEEGEPESADVTVEATSDDLVALINGELNAMAAFMQGRLKVKGDMSVAMKMQRLFS